MKILNFNVMIFCEAALKTVVTAIQIHLAQHLMVFLI